MCGNYTLVVMRTRNIRETHPNIGEYLIRIGLGSTYNYDLVPFLDRGLAIVFAPPHYSPDTEIYIGMGHLYKPFIFLYVELHSGEDSSKLT